MRVYPRRTEFLRKSVDLKEERFLEKEVLEMPESKHLGIEQRLDAQERQDTK